jgi:hypothetical protein
VDVESSVQVGFLDFIERGKSHTRAHVFVFNREEEMGKLFRKKVPSADSKKMPTRARAKQNKILIEKNACARNTKQNKILNQKKVSFFRSEIFPAASSIAENQSNSDTRCFGSYVCTYVCRYVHTHSTANAIKVEWFQLPLENGSPTRI